MELPNRSVFVSYVRSDADFALQLARDLKAAGVSAWIDQIDIPPGDRWDAAIEKALSRSECVVVVLSRASVQSTNVMDEVSFALDERKRVVPVMVEECPVPMRLRRLQFIDFSSKPQEALVRLLEAFSANPAANVDRAAIAPHSAAVSSPAATAISPRSEAASSPVGTGEPRTIRETSAGRFTPAAAGAPQRFDAEMLRRIFAGALVVALVGAVGIYLVFESNISETQMVSLSYYWVPLVAFGISGLTLTRDSLAKSAAVGALSVVLLAFFFSSIFPRL